MCCDILIGHVNIYHLDNKLQDVCALLQHHGLMHILGLTETRLLNHKHSSDRLRIPNYNLYRRDSTLTGHTGIAAYIHHNIIKYTTRRPDLEHEKIECLWFEVRAFKSSPLLIGFIYRNPASRNDWFDDYLHMMDKVNSLNINTVLLGDFNIDLLSAQSQWQTLIRLTGLKQLIQQPTRVTERSATLLDHIYTNNTNVIKKPSVSDLCMSDHKPIICKWSSKLPKPHTNKGHTYTIYRNFKTFNQVAFMYDISCTDFNTVMMCSEVNEAAQLLTNTLVSVLNKHAPVQRKRVKHATMPSWMTTEIRNAMTLRDQLKKTKQFTEYKAQRNKISELVRKAKRSLFQKLINNEPKNVSRIWTAMNKFTNKSRSNVTPNPILASPDQINNHFVSLADTLLNSTTCSPSPCFETSENLKQFCGDRLLPSDSFKIPLLAIHEVGRLVTELNNTKSMDKFYLNSSILKMTLPYISEALTHTYNLSIAQNTFPSVFKEARVIPLPKGDDTSSLDNLRPISILPVLSKPLERHIHKHLMNYLETKTLLHPFQSGFRPKHSCQTALTRLCDTWLDAINSRNMVGAVFLDLKKAFDLVSHGILLQKLKLYFQNISSLTLLSSYLSNRSQVVYLNGNLSSSQKVKYGVPQGSILGPTLFCLFINDLPLAINDTKATLDLFADDSTLHSQGHDTESIRKSLQKGIDDISSWCHKNRMILHPSKSKSMLIATRQKQQKQPQTLALTLTSKDIEQIREHRVLGVIIDDQLNWKYHINYLSKKISRNLYLLNKLRPLVTFDGLKSFFFAHCMSHVNYASTVWCKASDVHINKINALHKRGIKLLCTQSNLSTSERYDKLNILPLNKQFILNTAILMFKITNDDTPPYLNRFFQKPNSQQRLLNYKLPLPRIDLFKTSLAFWGSSVWNSLPLVCKSSIRMSNFKTTLKKHLAKNI